MSAPNCVACAFLVALLAVPGLAPGAATGIPADLVLTHGRLYTADPGRPTATALAVRGDRLVYVGDDVGAQAFVGPRTAVRDLGERRVLPGLVDSHIHPTDIVKPEACDLENRPVSLAELSAFVRGCIERYHVMPGHWVSVRQWNYGNGNTVDPMHRTLRAALDAASTHHPIHLLGNDGHHGAFNSVALAGARNRSGAAVGLSARTLETDFAASRQMVGVDEHGEPNGAVNETMQYAIDGPDAYASEREDFAALMRAPWKAVRQLNAAGITAMLDAAVPPERVQFYDALVRSGRLSVRAAIAQFYEPNAYHTADGAIDFDRMVALAERVRSRFRDTPLVRADVVKLFADGGIEGDPSAIPPTLPNGAVLRPYLQPRFRLTAAGKPELIGYVDTHSPVCEAERAHGGNDADSSRVAAFIAREGFHPAQCAISDGHLYQSRADIMEFVRRFHEHGFALHIHVIGDRAARTAIDAIEAARAGGGPQIDRDGLAHLELAHPDDVARIGRDRLYVAFTYAWADVEPDFDLSFIPFIDRIEGPSVEALHPAGGYFEQNGYPTRGVRDAGGILVGGSDAPVDTRDPRPFVNLARAVTRAIPGARALNPAQSITFRDALDSYTISGARFLGWGGETGSLEAGKSADFIVLDRDVMALADEGRFSAIEQTRVDETWFRGRRVYVRTRAREP